MPIYDYQCPKCGRVTEAARAVDERHLAPDCHGPMDRIISAPAMVMPDIQPYRAIVDGSTISSRAQHREYLRKHGLIEVGNEGKPKQWGFDERRSRTG